MNKSESDDIKDLIDAQYDGLRQSYEFIKSQVLNVVMNQLDLNKQERCILGTFLRVHSLVDSLLRLNQINDYDSVSMISRTVFELNIDLKLLSGSDVSEIVFDRFIKFPKMDRYKKALKARSLELTDPELIDQSVLGSEMRQSFIEQVEQSNSIEQEAVDLWGKELNKINHWTGQNLYERVQSLGKVTQYQYRELYALQSAYVHSGSSAYAGFSKESLKAVYGTSIDFARVMYLESIVICCKQFYLEKVLSGFFANINHLETAPETMLKNHWLSQYLD